MLVKGLQVVAKCCLNWIYVLMMTSIVVVNTQYSNVGYQGWELQNLSLKVMLKRKWLNLVLDVEFMTSNILKLVFFMFLEFIIYMRASSEKFVENHQFNVFFSVFQTNIKQLLVQYHKLAHHFHLNLGKDGKLSTLPCLHLYNHLIRKNDYMWHLDLQVNSHLWTCVSYFTGSGCRAQVVVLKACLLYITYYK